MLESGSWFWGWLAAQPPFIEIAIGVGFLLVLAPCGLALIALAAARAERVVEDLLLRSFEAAAQHSDLAAVQPLQDRVTSRGHFGALLRYCLAMARHTSRYETNLIGQ
jgi:hypothetical protein